MGQPRRGRGCLSSHPCSWGISRELQGMQREKGTVSVLDRSERRGTVGLDRRTPAWRAGDGLANSIPAVAIRRCRVLGIELEIRKLRLGDCAGWSYSSAGWPKGSPEKYWATRTSFKYGQGRARGEQGRNEGANQQPHDDCSRSDQGLQRREQSPVSGAGTTRLEARAAARRVG